MRITISDFFPLLSIFTIRRGFLASRSERYTFREWQTLFREGEKETITILTTYVLDCIGIRPRVFDIAKRRSMLRRFLSCRSRPIQSALIRENILNSNGEREKKGSFFSTSSSDHRNKRIFPNSSSAKRDARNELDCESVTMHKHP